MSCVRSIEKLIKAIQWIDQALDLRESQGNTVMSNYFFFSWNNKKTYIENVQD